MEEDVPALTSLHKRNFKACDISWTTLRNLKGFLYEGEKSKKLLTRMIIYAENFALPPLYDSSRTNNCEHNLSFLFTGNQIWYMRNREIIDRSGWSHHTCISIEILFPLHLKCFRSAVEIFFQHRLQYMSFTKFLSN